MAKKISVVNNKKILIGITDDSPQITTTLAQLLEHNGFDTYKASDGSDAVHLTEEKEPALLICDIRMRGISGYDVAKMLPKQKILFITGFDIDETKIKGLNNVVGVMKKPVDINILLSKIKKVLDGRK